MQIVTHIDNFKALCKVKRCWGLYINTDHDDWAEFRKAVPWWPHPAEMSLDEWQETRTMQCIMDGAAYVFCDSQAECENLFFQIVGDDGPTALNPYDGPCRVYAFTVSPNGAVWNENT